MKMPRFSSIWILIVGLLGVGLAYLATIVAPLPGDKAAQMPVPVTKELIARGAYLARVGDCVACHSKPGGADFAGGVAINSPIGGMVPPNITPDPTYGIGNYSYGDFVRAVRYGIDPQGQTLYPAMPWPAYSKIADNDVAALYAYFMKEVSPVAQPADKNTIVWPLSMRWPVAYWRWLFGPAGNAPKIAPEAGVELGAYYVEGLGHCGTCHTPRAFPTLQEKALDSSQGTEFLAGGQVIDGFATPSLRGEINSGLGRVDSATIAEILQTGHSLRHATFGGMSDVITHSTQYMKNEDLQAMADYLKGLIPHRQEGPIYYDGGGTTSTLSQKNYSKVGAQLFEENCAGCHLENGFGYGYKFPSLALNSATMNPNPAGLIKIVLAGQAIAQTQHSQAAYFMPAFAKRLSDQQIADIVGFIRSSWGNNASAVTSADVASARKNLAP